MAQMNNEVVQQQFPAEWRFNVQTSAFSAEERFVTMLGYSKETKVGIKELFDAIQRNQVERARQVIRHVYMKGGTQELRLVMYANKKRHIACINVWKESQKSHVVIGTLELLMPLPEHQEDLNIFLNVFNTVKQAVLVSDQNHRIMMANKAFCKETGYAESEILGELASFFSTDETNQDFFDDIWKRANHEGVWEGEIVTRNKSGEASVRQLSLYFFVIPSTGLQYYVGISTRISAVQGLNLKDAAYRAPSEAFYDAKQFSRLLEGRLNKMPKEQALVGFTLDITFKSELDETTRRWLMTKLLSPFSDEITFAQFSKNIFAGYFVCSKKVGEIHSRLEKLLYALTTDTETIRRGIHLSACIGVSVLGLDATKTQSMLGHASQALLARRVHGVSSIQYHDSRLQKATESKQALTLALEGAINQESIDIYYQPIVDIHRLEVVCFEAKLNLASYHGEESSIEEVLRIINDKGWTNQIDYLVAKQALKDLSHIQAHYTDTNIKVLLHRSLSQGRDEVSAIEDILLLIAESGVSFEKVVLELANFSADSSANRQGSKWLDKINALPIELLINHSESNTTLFNALKYKHISQLKVNIAQLQAIDVGNSAYMVLEVMARILNSQEANIVATEVRDTKTLNRLRKIGVRYVQGEVFSLPYGVSDIIANPPLNLRKFHMKLDQDTFTTAKDVMCTEVPRMGMDEKLDAIRAQLAKSPHPFVLIIEDSQCEGVLFETDLQAAISPYIDTEAEQPRDKVTLNKRAHQVMSKALVTVDSDAPVEEVKIRLRSSPKHMLVVVGETGVCVGVITPLELLT